MIFFSFFTSNNTIINKFLSPTIFMLKYLAILTTKYSVIYFYVRKKVFLFVVLFMFHKKF